jgi:hypothetical protein
MTKVFLVQLKGTLAISMCIVSSGVWGDTIFQEMECQLRQHISFFWNATQVFNKYFYDTRRVS